MWVFCRKEDTHGTLNPVNKLLFLVSFQNKFYLNLLKIDQKVGFLMMYVIYIWTPYHVTGNKSTQDKRGGLNLDACI